MLGDGILMKNLTIKQLIVVEIEHGNDKRMEVNAV
jgi:hypothetical protein